MEYVETAQDSPFPPAQIPVLDPEPYDGVDFLSYPESKGWDTNRLLAGDFSEHENPAAFLQNWLFFGVLHEVFGPIDQGGKHQYVANGEVTVAFLDEQILQLSNFITANAQNGISDEALQIGRRIETCLQTVSRFSRLATCEEDPRLGFAVWPLSAEIDMSIRALSQRLAWSFSVGALNMVFSASTGGLVFPCAWLPLKRMQEAGWCPSEIALVGETFTSASAYYTSQLEPPPSAREKDHSACTRTTCEARQLNEETYRTAHAPTTHTAADCDCLHHGPAIEEITSIIDSGGVPLLSITPSKKEPSLKISVEKYTEGKRYIAFSHVWSDGLGNPTHNTLPLCQLKRIQSLLDELVAGISSADLVNRLAFRELWSKKFHGPSLLFWMDTLCIPVAEEYKPLRSKAIKSMKAVYERAFRVLVLDADIQSFPSTDYTQAFMRIRMSAWMRRLWTLNEGVLANTLCIRFSDGFLDVEARSDAQRKESYGSPLGNIKYSFGTPMRDADNFHWKFRLLRVNVLSEPDPRLIKRTGDPLASPEMKRCFAIMEAFSAALYRTTSKPSDEMLCFASLIGWDISLIKGLEFEDRMHALLSSERILPQGLLFLAGPRMSQPGWKWSVNRFANCGARRLDAKYDDFRLGNVTENGFAVQYTGVAFSAGFTKDQAERAILDIDLGNGVSASVEVKRHDEGEGFGQEAYDAEEEDLHDQLYVLFWDPSLSMPPRTPLAAVVISGPSDESLVKGDVVYRFEFLAYMEVLEKRFEGEGNADEEKGAVAPVIEKRWTIG
ncbi:hypothetical protein BJY04DRAFT_227015 [Aspergillus karnatakaensis]|uniref:uncharacterized protein n=1 Tax=Aspergillus karnatakaensis TaxID=1810916 RepID=UPI003CCDE07F